MSGAAANTTSESASAATPPRPNNTHGPNCGSRTIPAISSRLPRTISATSSCTSPSAGRTFASNSLAAARTASAFARPSLTKSRSVLCAIASPHNFTTTGKPMRAAAAAAPAASRANSSRETGTP